jgi:enoyl-CoA hydratase/carnithine racemase
MSEQSLVLVEVSSHVATITLNDPRKRNAMTPELGDALAAAVATVRADATVRAVVLTGAGGAFSGGGDLKMLERLRGESFEGARAYMLSFYARYLSITGLSVPTVAAITGPAIGAGLCVALGCDLCVVDEDAPLALNFAQIGLYPGMGATYLTPRRVGPQRAAELLLTGRRFGGEEAARMGLALVATRSGGALVRATEIASQIASSAPLVVRALKAELGVDHGALGRALEEEARHQASSYGSADLGEGLAAVSARRRPHFSGS